MRDELETFQLDFSSCLPRTKETIARDQAHMHLRIPSRFATNEEETAKPRACQCQGGSASELLLLLYRSERSL